MLTGVNEEKALEERKEFSEGIQGEINWGKLNSGMEL
jgi:hypothetical protein